VLLEATAKAGDGRRRAGDGVAGWRGSGSSPWGMGDGRGGRGGEEERRGREEEWRPSALNHMIKERGEEREIGNRRERRGRREERRREETGNGPSSVVNHMIKVRGGRGEETLCVKLGIGNERERRGEETLCIKLKREERGRGMGRGGRGEEERRPYALSWGLGTYRPSALNHMIKGLVLKIGSLWLFYG
jgi:hypothetical protein